MSREEDDPAVIDEDELDAMQARAAAAGADVWTVDGCSVFPGATFDTWKQQWRVYEIECWVKEYAVFIASARTDVPRLIAYVRRLEAEVERLEENIADMVH